MNNLEYKTAVDRMNAALSSGLYWDEETFDAAMQGKHDRLIGYTPDTIEPDEALKAWRTQLEFEPSREYKEAMDKGLSALDKREQANRVLAARGCLYG